MRDREKYREYQREYRRKNAERIAKQRHAKYATPEGKAYNKAYNKNRKPRVPKKARRAEYDKKYRASVKLNGTKKAKREWLPQPIIASEIELMRDIIAERFPMWTCIVEQDVLRIVYGRFTATADKSGNVTTTSERIKFFQFLADNEHKEDIALGHVKSKDGFRYIKSKAKKFVR